MRYRDAPAAIEFLCAAFGFQRHLVIEGENGTIDHAQLTLGGGMVMLGTAREDEFGRLQQPPSSPQAPITQSPYIVVDDIDAHYERALGAGAQVAVALKEEDYGGKVYACRDPEGHLWNFGSYDPWADEA